MWRIWYFSSFFERYVPVPGMPVFSSAIDAGYAAAAERFANDNISFVVWPL